MAGDKLTNIPVLKTGLDLAAPGDAQPIADETTRKLYLEAQPSLVRVTTEKGSGTGFFADKDGRIITSANHLINTKEQFVTCSDGKKYKAELVAIDDISDLAVLRIKDGVTPRDLKPLPMGKSAELKPDQSTYGLGFPKGYETAYISPGYVRSLTSLVDVVTRSHPTYARGLTDALHTLDVPQQQDLTQFLKHPLVQAQQYGVSGYSGGPLLDSSGKVVGIARINDTVTDSTYFSSAEAASALLSGGGKKFEFSYGYRAAPLAEKYLDSWRENPVRGALSTAAIGAIGGVTAYGGYKALRYLPKGGGLCVGLAGATMLTSDAGEFLKSTDSRDSWKYGLASLADTSTTGGALLAMSTKGRPYGIALIGAGVVGRAATEFIRNRWTLEETKRTDGTDRQPFEGNKFLR